jgi:hypothetical protein
MVRVGVSRRRNVACFSSAAFLSFPLYSCFCFFLISWCKLGTDYAQVDVFPVTGFGVSVATDGALYPTEVYS